jgi:hypothetical protein
MALTEIDNETSAMRRANCLIEFIFKND